MPLIAAMGWPSWAASVRYRRGFIWRVDAPLKVALDHLPALRRLHPVERVRVTNPCSARVRLTPGYRAHYTWWREDAVNYNGGIPGFVWYALDGYKQHTPQWSGAKDYDSDRLAQLALSRAILKLTEG